MASTKEKLRWWDPNLDEVEGLAAKLTVKVQTWKGENKPQVQKRFLGHILSIIIGAFLFQYFALTALTEVFR